MNVHATDARLVAADLDTDPHRGLTTEEAGARLARHGPNELEAGEQLSAGRILLGQLTSPMVLLLAAAGILSAALGDVTEAIFIFFVVVLNAWIGFRQEYRAEKAMASLQALATPTVKVRRHGVTQEIAARELVPGDVVLLDAGSRVPADGRLTEAHALRVEESALTGESVPVDKRVEPVSESTPLAERTSMAYAGTSVTAGRGALVVTSTGMASELGRVADLLHGADEGRTPLQQRLDTLVKWLALLAGAVVALVFAIGLVRGEEPSRRIRGSRHSSSALGVLGVLCATRGRSGSFRGSPCSIRRNAHRRGDVGLGVVRAVPVAALRGVTWLAYRDVAGPLRCRAAVLPKSPTRTCAWGGP